MRCIECIVIVWMVGVALFSCRNMQAGNNREDDVRGSVKLALPALEKSLSAVDSWLDKMNCIPGLELLSDTFSKGYVRPEQVGSKVRVNIVNLVEEAVITVRNISLRDTMECVASESINYDIILGSSITDILMPTMYREGGPACLEVTVRYDLERSGYKERKDRVYRYVLEEDLFGIDAAVSHGGLYDATLVLMDGADSPEAHWKVTVRPKTKDRCFSQLMERK